MKNSKENLDRQLCGGGSVEKEVDPEIASARKKFNDALDGGTRRARSGPRQEPPKTIFELDNV